MGGAEWGRINEIWANLKATVWWKGSISILNRKVKFESSWQVRVKWVGFRSFGSLNCSTILTWSDPFKLGWKYKPSPDQKLGSGWVGVRWVGLSQKLPPPWVTNVAYLLFTMTSEAVNCSMFTELKKFCTLRSCILHCSKRLPLVIMTTIHEKVYETKGPGLGHWTMAPPEQTWHISIFFRSSHKCGPPRSSTGSTHIMDFKHVIHVKNESTNINTLHLTNIFDVKHYTRSANSRRFDKTRGQYSFCLGGFCYEIFYGVWCSYTSAFSWVLYDDFFLNKFFFLTNKKKCVITCNIFILILVCFST